MENNEVVGENVGLVQVETEQMQPPFGMNFKEWFGYKAKLAAKKNKVLAGVARIPKNGFNREHNYNFARESDVNDGLRELMKENKLDFDVELVSVRDYEAQARYEGKKGSPITEAIISVTWTDCETGYFETRKFMGRGLDFQEKGIYKAYTGAIKYFMLKTFLIATGDDPENDTPEPQAQPNGQNGPQGGRNNSGNQRQGQGQQNRSSGQRGSRSAQENKPEQPQEQKQQEQPQPDPAHDNAITADQVGKIKTKVLTLAAFSDEKNKTTAQNAVFESLRVKLKTKFGDIGAFKELTDMTTSMAETAIFCLDEWIELKNKKKQQNQTKESEEK